MNPNKKPSFSYEERIKTIMDYFGVSQPAALFLFHRKRRGLPLKKPDDPKFIAWSLPLQNALVMADGKNGWLWSNVHFGKEEKLLNSQGIFLSESPEIPIYRNEMQYSEFDGWEVVKNERRIKSRQMKVLQSMGFLPRHNN